MDLSKVYKDEIGRCYCNAHRRELCNECMLNFEVTNKMVKEQIGLQKPPSWIETLANQKVALERSIAFLMDWEDPRTRPENHLHDQKVELARVEKELEELRRDGNADEIDASISKCREEAKGKDLDRDAFVSAFLNKHPGTTHFDPSGKEAQELYEKYISKPPSAKRDQSHDPYTCSYCLKHSKTKLMACARCGKQAYCSKACQIAQWKAHKKECQPIGTISKSGKKKHRLPLTFAQLEKFEVAQGKELEVRFIRREQGQRLIALSKDRAGVTKRVAAYTVSKDIPGYRPGKVMRWKNPRIYHFKDGISGVRIEEKDLQNITIED